MPTAGAILDRFLHHAQTIAITGRSYRLKDHATIAGKEHKNRKPNPSLLNLRPQNRRAEWLATGSARSTSLLTHCGKPSVFAANRPY
jgi:hypothetical protein